VTATKRRNSEEEKEVLSKVTERKEIVVKGKEQRHHTKGKQNEGKYACS
jgi:hypothetical protein